MAQASNEQIEGVDLTNCKLDYCVKLKTFKLYRSPLSPSYAFGPSKLVVFQNNQATKEEFIGFEGSFDPRAHRFYLSKEDSPFDYVIDGIDKKIYKFPKSMN